MYYYAQINDNGECIGISELEKKDNRSNLIEIPFLNDKLLGLFYNHENQEWYETPENPEKLIPETQIMPTQLDRIENYLLELLDIIYNIHN